MKYYYHALAAILVGGCILHPISAAIGLLIVFTAKFAEIYFTHNISDKDRLEIELIKNDLQKLKIKSEQEGLSKAFSRVTP